MIGALATLVLAADAAEPSALLTQALVGLATAATTAITVLVTRRKAPPDCAEAIAGVEAALTTLTGRVDTLAKEVSYLAGFVDGSPRPTAYAHDPTPPPRPAIRVVVVDDEAHIRLALTRLGKIEGWAVEAVASVSEALPMLAGAGVVVTDYPTRGDALITEAGIHGVPVVVYSGRPDATRPDGVAAVVPKSAGADALVEEIRAAAARRVV